MAAKTATRYEPGYLVAGKYELESLLGEGGMGAVWRARNVALDSPVAIKVVRAVGDQTVLRGRLMQEARASAKLTHPAIVKVFDVGQTDTGDPFIVMELLQGDTLSKILEAGSLSAVQAARTLLPIADALWLAHSKGLVHRDLKPDNVFVVQHEGTIQPKLVDFGIVKVQEAEGQTHLTRAGDVVGSPDYMSPEQARGLDDVDHLTDVWSFTVLLYEAVAGRTPFIGANYNALLRQIVEDTPPSLHELGVADADFSAIVARGLNKEPAQRFESMGELGRALATWLLGQGINEDICGSTLEAKWLRGVDSSGRAGRPRLASVADGWPAESGSGVRRFQSEVPTVLVPGRPTRPVEPQSSSQWPVPKRRAVWILPAGVGVVLLVALALVFGRSASETSPAASAPAPTWAGQAPSGPAVPASTDLREPPVLPSHPSGLPAEPAPRSPGESESPKVPPSAAAASQGGKPSPRRPAKGVGSTGKAPRGDLLSPY